MTKKIPTPDGLGNEYKSGKSIRDLARRHGISTPTILRMLRELKVETRPESEVRQFPDSLLQEYNAGARISDLVTNYRSNDATVKRAIEEQGGTIRTLAETRHLRAEIKYGNQIRKEYDDGDNVTTLSERHHLSSKTINRLLNLENDIKGAHYNLPRTLRIEYEEGASLNELAEAYQVKKPETIARRIRAQGGQIRMPGSKVPPPYIPTAAEIATIKFSYDKLGNDITQIHEDTGIPHRSIRKVIVDDPDIELRLPPGGRRQ